MKYLRMTLLLGLCSIIQPVLAQDNSQPLSSTELENYVGYGFVAAILILLIVALFVILRAVKVLSRAVLKSQGYSEEQIIAELKPVKDKKAKEEVWLK